MKQPGHYNPDIRDDFKVALINYGKRKNGKALSQKDFDPTINRSHINNVASGRDLNRPLRQRIEDFIKQHK